MKFTFNRSHERSNVAQCRDIAAAAHPQGPLAKTASAVQGKGEGGVSLGSPGEPLFEVSYSLILHLSVERQGDVPLFGERPRQDLVAMISCSGGEVRDNVVRQYDGGEEPHWAWPRSAAT